MISLVVTRLATAQADLESGRRRLAALDAERVGLLAGLLRLEGAIAAYQDLLHAPQPARYPVQGDARESDHSESV